MAKGFARTFGQDIMRGEHVVGGEKAHPAIPGRGKSGVAPTYKDTSFYKQKTAKEAELGRKLSTEEFTAEHYQRKGDFAGLKAAGVAPGAKGGASGAYVLGGAKLKATQDKAFRSSAAVLQGQLNGGFSEDAAVTTGTSIFDPVLTELAYKWFCPPGGWILDPFAGGSVRGIVASTLGFNYVGIDLRAEQLSANEKQARQICGEPQPSWICGDSRNLDQLCEGLQADLIFSCPPYADLEVYSDDPADLSTLSYDEFRPAYSEIIAKACALLKPDRFACFVVGDVRGKDGLYYGFPWHTIEAFNNAGLALYNEAVLVTAVGSLPVRIGKQFRSSKKLGKTHQNFLIFVKGDPKRAAQAVSKEDTND